MQVKLGLVTQVAWVVDDLEASMRRWIDGHGVGPFMVLRHCQVTDLLHRGRPATCDFDVAIAQSGTMQVELIQQHDDRPSVYRDLFRRGQEGIHHVCHVVDDLPGAIAHFRARRAEIAVEGHFGAVRFAYMDTCSSIGVMTELVGRHPDIEAFFKMIAEAADGWDGKNPIRYL